MIDETQLRRLAANGKQWAIEAVRDLEEDDAKQAEAARLASAQAELEKVHDLQPLQKEPLSEADFFALNTGDVSRLDVLEDPGGRRVRIVRLPWTESGHQGPWFVPSWLAPHLKGLPYAQLFELRMLPRTHELLRAGARSDHAENDFAALVKRCQSMVALAAWFAHDAVNDSDPKAERRARLVDERMRTLGVNMLGDNRAHHQALLDRVQSLFDLEVPGTIAQHQDHSRLATVRQLRRQQAEAAAKGSPDAA